MSPLSLLLLWISALLPSQEGLAHGNGVKIGEVSATTAVVWTRLTQTAEALQRIDGWQEGWAPEEYPWRLPAASGELRFVVWPKGQPSDRMETAWTAVGRESDACPSSATDRAAGRERPTNWKPRAGPESSSLPSAGPSEQLPPPRKPRP